MEDNLGLTEPKKLTKDSKLEKSEEKESNNFNMNDYAYKEGRSSLRNKINSIKTKYGNPRQFR